jgi:hypothetical protein
MELDNHLRISLNTKEGHETKPVLRWPVAGLSCCIHIFENWHSSKLCVKFSFST